MFIKTSPRRNSSSVFAVAAAALVLVSSCGPQTLDFDATASEPGAGASEDHLTAALSAGDVVRGHPRLLLTADGWRARAGHVAWNPTLAAYVGLLRKEADRVNLAGEPLFHCGIPAGNIGRIALDRMYLFASLARVLPVGERDAYVIRGRAELEAIVGARCFDLTLGTKDLVTAETAHAVAIGYDWLYPDLSPEQRARARGVLAEFVRTGLLRLGAGGGRKAWWATSTSNWNLVCNAGFATAALAVIHDSDQTLSADALRLLDLVLTAADQAGRSGGSTRSGTSGYGVRGDWHEGPSYWHYATRYAGLLVMALDSAAPSWAARRQLWAAPGYGLSYLYRVHVEGPAGTAFNYSDAPERYSVSRDGDHPLWFLARALQGADAETARSLAWTEVQRDVSAGQLHQNPFLAASHLVAFSGSAGVPSALAGVRQFDGT